MACYDYRCEVCKITTELSHSMFDTSMKFCEKCRYEMVKQVSCGYIASKGFNPTLEDHRESENTAKVKDHERAVKMRKRAFGHDAVGDPVDSSDPIHIVKRGKTIGGQEKTIDKGEFVRAASKDPYMVQIAKNALESRGKK